MHSPWANMLKYFKFLNLSPQIEDYLPKKLFVSPSFPRSILSFDLGKESNDLDNYLKKWINIRGIIKIIGSQERRLKSKII